jgi:Protein of unknown function (DUF3617)
MLCSGDLIMLKTSVALMASVALLTGCGGSNDVSLKNASVAEVAKASADADRLDPGAWTSTVEVVSIDMPGINGPEKQVAQAMFKNMLGQKQVSERCVTPSEAIKPPEELLSGKGPNMCRFQSFDLSGGKLKAQMSCMSKTQGGGMTMTMAGDYGRSSFALDTEMTITNDAHMPGGQGMVIKAKSIGKRTGACSAKGTI